MAEGKEPRRRTEPPPAASAAANPRGDGRVRAVIDGLSPRVDGGRFPAKRIAGEPVCVEAFCFTDGHDQLRVVLAWRAVSGPGVYEVEMQPRGNDVWTAEFTPPAPGRYSCTVTAWVDHFESWRKELERREELGDIRVALRVGSALISETAARAGDADARVLRDWAALLLESAKPEATVDAASLKSLALDPERARLMRRHSDRSLADSAALEIFADRKRAAEHATRGIGKLFEFIRRPMRVYHRLRLFPNCEIRARIPSQPDSPPAGVEATARHLALCQSAF